MSGLKWLLYKACGLSAIVAALALAPGAVSAEKYVWLAALVSVLFPFGLSATLQNGWSYARATEPRPVLSASAQKWHRVGSWLLGFSVVSGVILFLFTLVACRWFPDFASTPGIALYCDPWT